MAWLYEHPRSKYWFIGWRVGKKTFNRSTRLTDRKEAEKKLAVFDLMSNAKRINRLTEDFYLSLSGQESNRMAVSQSAEIFLNNRKGSTRPGTFIRYKMVIELFLKYVMATEAGPLIGDVDPNTIQSFLNDARRKTSATTANFYRKVMNGLFRHALDNDKIKTNPVRNIATFKQSADEIEAGRRPFEESEIRAAYAAAPNDFWRFAIVLGLYTGLRLGNVATLRWQNVHQESKLIEVIDIKSPDKLVIPIASPFLLNMLAEMRRASGDAKPESFIFPEYAEKYLTKSVAGENSPAKLSLEFRSILVSAGLLGKYERKSQGTGRTCRRAVSALSFHSLRHNFVTMLKENGASQMVARELAGHSSDAVSELYTHTSQAAIRKSVKKLPEVFK